MPFYCSFIHYSDVDECKVSNPCKNGATCTNSVGGYSCQCPANYKGKHCDEGIIRYCIINMAFKGTVSPIFSVTLNGQKINLYR